MFHTMIPLISQLMFFILQIVRSTLGQDGFRQSKDDDQQ